MKQISLSPWVSIPFLLTFLFVISSTIVYSQEEKKSSPKKLLKDIDELVELIDAHPDPYTHISEEAFQAKLDDIKNSITEPLTTLEFYKKAAALVALFKDGHSAVYLPRHWMQQQRKLRGAFPYKVHLNNNNELFVLENYNNGEIPVGAKIIQINGMSVADFVNEVSPYISYETENFRNTIIDGNFEQYLYLAFGLKDQTTIEYFTSKNLTAEVNNMAYKEWKKFQKDNRAEREEKIAKGEPYDYENLGKGVGLIHIYAFSVPDFTAYKIFLSKTFKKIKKDSIHSLVIDIRGNFGGWPKVASHLFHYISDNYFKTMAKSDMKVSHAYRNSLYDRMPFLRGARPYIPHRQHYIDLNTILSEKAGTHVEEGDFFNEPPEVKNYEFEGDCYLLTNRDSYSAASCFASTFQCYQMGLIVGEKTGGTKIFRANPIPGQLMRTGLRVRMSTTKLYATCYNEEFEGVTPHVEFSPSIIELSSGMDMQLLYTQRLIRKVQRSKAEEAAKN